MTEEPEPQPSRTLVEEPGSGWRRWSVLLPALSFVAGLVLGGAVVGAATRDSGSGGAVAASPSPSSGAASPSPSGTSVIVPGTCVQAADEADRAYALLERGIKAARDVDAGALADIVAEVQQKRPGVQSLVRQCRQQAAATVVSPAPTASPSG